MRRYLIFFLLTLELSFCFSLAKGQDILAKRRRSQFGVAGSISTSFLETVPDPASPYVGSMSYAKIPSIGCKAGFLVRYNLSR